MVRICLVQHGDALPSDLDKARPLSEAGQQDVERLANFLGRQDLGVSKILHSGKLRAHRTAEVIASKLPGEVTAVPTSGLAPKDPVKPWVKELAHREDNVFIVGHLPFLGKLAALLVVGNEEANLLSFQPGTAAYLERADDGSWSVAWLVRPEVLRLLHE